MISIVEGLEKQQEVILVTLLQGRMADSLAELDLQIIETPPKYEISLPTLLSCLETDQAEEEEDEESTSEEIYMEVTPAKAERLLEEARQTLGEQLLAEYSVLMKSETPILS